MSYRTENPGFTYDELIIGDSASFSKTITETDIALFAGISGDFNPVHMNDAYAKKTKFGARIAHGPLTTSLIAPVIGTKLPGQGTIALEIFSKFLLPVYIGDTITAKVEVKEKLSEKKLIKLALSWINQSQRLVAEGHAIVKPGKGI